MAVTDSITDPGILSFRAWLVGQVEHKSQAVRRMACLARMRHRQLDALYQAHDWPWFTAFAVAMGIDSNAELVSELGRAWFHWRNTPGASKPPKIDFTKSATRRTGETP